MSSHTTRTTRDLHAHTSAHRWETRDVPASREGETTVLPFPQQAMLARPVGALPDESELPGGAAYEPKFDGYRAMIFVQSGWCRIQARDGSDITRSFPEIAAAAVDNLPSGVVIDGELVVWGDDLSDFSALQARLAGDEHDPTSHPASFIAFDVLAGAGMDMRRSPFRVRRQALTILLDDAPAPLHVVPQTRDVEEARTWLANYAEAHVGVEGVVAKGLATHYSPGERGWEKIRLHDSTEYVVGGIVGTPASPERLVLGRPDSDGVLQVAGCTSALTLPHRRRLSALLREDDLGPEHPWATTTTMLDVPGWDGGEGRMTLVSPTMVVEVTEPAEADGHHELLRPRPELRVGDVDPLPAED